MKTVLVAGKTDAIITLNKSGVPIRGKTPTLIVLDTLDKEGEINGLVRAGFVEILEDSSKEQDIQENLPTCEENSEENEEAEEGGTEKGKKGGRPKGSKNKKIKPINQQIEEARRVKKSEDKTQEMGSEVIIGTGKGTVKGKMKHSAIDDNIENESTKASIDEMNKIEAEEKIAKEKLKIDESKLPPSDQMGRQATISIEGKTKSVPMETNSIPGSKEIQEKDPFIDSDDKSDDVDDAFIEI